MLTNFNEEKLLQYAMSFLINEIKSIEKTIDNLNVKCQDDDDWELQIDLLKGLKNEYSADLEKLKEYYKEEY